MIYTPATVYYRLEPVRGYHLFVVLFCFFFFFSSSLSSFSSCSSLYALPHFLHLGSHTATPRISVVTPRRPVFSDGRRNSTRVRPRKDRVSRR